MSRSQQQVFNQMVASYIASAAAAGIVIDNTKWSKYNLQQLIFWTVAGGQAIFEQIFDNYTAEIESDVAVASPQTPPWIQNMVLNVFQWDATTPQIPILDITDGTFAPEYDPEDATKRIVTACVVVPGIFGTTTVKALTGGSSPVALTTGSTSQLSSLQSFLNFITLPEINVNAVTGNTDKLYVQGLVTYNGGYSSVIQATVVAAIQTFLLSIPTSGIAGINSPVGLLKLTDLIAAVRAVAGVVDFELINVNARPDGISFVPGTNNLVSGTVSGTGPYVISADWLNSSWNSGLNGIGTIAGENSVGYTLNDSIIYYAT